MRGRLSGNLKLKETADPILGYRVATAGAVLVSVLAAVLEGAVSRTPGVIALIGVPIGFVVSYRRQHARNLLLKMALAAALLLAFAAFLAAVRSATNVDDTRGPLVGVFLWAQVLHSFDVPRPRDLSFSLAAGVALIALAGSLAFSSSFLLYVLPFTAFLVTALVLAHAADLRSEAGSALAKEVTAGEAKRGSGWSIRPAARLTALTLAVTTLVFVFIPRLPGAQIAALPFSIVRRTPVPGFAGGVAQPQRGGGGRAGGFEPGAYFGYGETVDLRVRGKLSDELVLRVRSPRATLYRAQAFDTYGRGSWTSSDRSPVDITTAEDGSIAVPVRPEEPGSGDELIQTFYVERDLPNVLFHSYRADEVYIPSAHLRVDDSTSMRLPFFLEQDTIYSVISRVTQESPETLRWVPAVDPSEPLVRRYLQTPADLRGRFTTLANQITANHRTEIDKVLAVQDWLHEHKKYSLDISRDPPGRDPVDVFVFDRDSGFCEQIAATMALMLRASGVPARLVTGFGPGERNLFTGYWEVRNSDAHAWVEVLYPGAGWVTYDPTFGVPDSGSANSTFVFGSLQRFAARVFPGSVAGKLIAALSAFASAAPIASAVLGLVAVFGLISLLVRRVRGRAVSRRSAGDRVVRAWLEIERALRRRGYERSRDETAIEVGARARSLDDLLPGLSEEFSVLRYGPARSDEEIADFEHRASAAARAVLRDRKS